MTERHLVEKLPAVPYVHFGRPLPDVLHETLQLWNARSIVVVHGKQSFTASGARQAIVPALAGWRVRYFNDITSNPCDLQVSAGIDVARIAQPDAVIGIGGGSILDTAKLMAAFCGTDLSLQAYLSSRVVIPRRRVRLILIPTTAGSGSEMTQFASVYVDGRKCSIDDPHLLADSVVLEPAFVDRLERQLDTACGLDSLAHAMESYWSVAATPESRSFAAIALDGMTTVLHGAISGRRYDPGSRLLAAAFGGAAINISRTTAAHALSYWITSRFGVPHGAAVGMNLPWLLLHNAKITDADCRHPLGATAVRQMIADIEETVQRTTGQSASVFVRKVLAYGGYAQSPAQLFLPAQVWQEMIRDGLSSSRAQNNPRQISEEDVLRICHSQERHEW